MSTTIELPATANRAAECPPAEQRLLFQPISVVDSALFSRGSDQQHGGTGPGCYVTVFACEITFGRLASLIVAWFSRQREFRAEAGSARLLGTPPGSMPQSLRAFGITDAPAWLGLLASHPPLEARIAALQQYRASATAASQ